MKYTYQTWSESGSFGNPYDGTEVEHASSLDDLRRALESWMDEHEQVGADPINASLTVYRGTLDDVTDIYPDFQLVAGPRGGIQRL